MKEISVSERNTKVMGVSSIKGNGTILFVSGGLQFIHLENGKKCRLSHTIAIFSDGSKREYLDIVINDIVSMSFAGISELDFKNVFVTTLETESKKYY